MVSVAASGSTSCDPSLVSYALEQPEMLRSPDYRHKCDNFICIILACGHCISKTLERQFGNF